jgi:hypothetical protein
MQNKRQQAIEGDAMKARARFLLTAAISIAMASVFFTR